MRTEDDNNEEKRGERKGREEQPAFSAPNMCVRTVLSTFKDVTLDPYQTPLTQAVLASQCR